MTAGPDGFRERDHNTQAASIGRWSFRVHSFVGSTDHHLLQLSLHLGTGERFRRPLHVWTAPEVQGFAAEFGERCDGGHVSGLLTRHYDRWPRWVPRTRP